MDDHALLKILKTSLSKKGEITLSCNGDSMMPYINSGDKIIVINSDYYFPGDILTFNYRGEGLITHRLVKKFESVYLCKGDNSFRIENITYEQILGKVSCLERENYRVSLVDVDDAFLELSYKIGIKYIKSFYNIEKTKSSEIYKLFYNKYIRKNKL